MNSGPSRFDGERRFGDRDGYRGGPRGSGGDFGDKGGAPADYRPSFGVSYFTTPRISQLLIFLFKLDLFAMPTKRLFDLDISNLSYSSLSQLGVSKSITF